MRSNREQPQFWGECRGGILIVVHARDRTTIDPRRSDVIDDAGDGDGNDDDEIGFFFFFFLILRLKLAAIGMALGAVRSCPSHALRHEPDHHGNLVLPQHRRVGKVDKQRLRARGGRGAKTRNVIVSAHMARETYYMTEENNLCTHFLMLQQADFY